MINRTNGVRGYVGDYRKQSDPDTSRHEHNHDNVRRRNRSRRREEVHVKGLGIMDREGMQQRAGGGVCSRSQRHMGHGRSDEG